MKAFLLHLTLKALLEALNDFGTNETPHLVKPAADAHKAVTTLKAAIENGPTEEGN